MMNDGTLNFRKQFFQLRGPSGYRFRAKHPGLCASRKPAYAVAGIGGA
jgi:hypothetical protein